MKMKQRSTLIKGRILASVITFILLLVFLIVAAQFGLIGGRENDEQPVNEDSLGNLVVQARPDTWPGKEVFNT